MVTIVRLVILTLTAIMVIFSLEWQHMLLIIRCNGKLYMIAPLYLFSFFFNFDEYCDGDPGYAEVRLVMRLG